MISKEWTCNNCGEVVTRNPDFAEESMPIHRKYGKSHNDKKCLKAEFTVVEVEIKTAHDWAMLDLDLGSFWRCRRCAATNSYGADWGNGPDHDSFWACGCGTDVNHGVSEDCDIAKAAILAHIPTCRCGKCVCGRSKSAHDDKVVGKPGDRGGGRTIREINGACANFVLETDLTKL